MSVFVEKLYSSLTLPPLPPYSLLPLLLTHSSPSSSLTPPPPPIRSDDANKSFSAAVQLHDSLVKGWAQWGDYLYQLFELESNITLSLSVITCYLHACRTQKESKCRKFIARVIWLLTYDDQKGTLAEVRVQLTLGSEFS